MSTFSSFYDRPKGGKISSNSNEERKDLEVDIREDEEQKIKFQEIIDLLVAAGYFRARIKGLSAFDKVVGGMTWCIETCNFDVDVDLLFQENSTIGQKIALTEKIVAVLPKMKCPHAIEPHQIQGLDFIHIFPVIQWLVKKAMETRAEMGDQVRAYAVSQFNRMFTLPEEKALISQQETILKNICIVKDIYRPQRRFRRKGPPPDDEETQVHSTLLEYGYNLVRKSSPKNLETNESDDSGQQPTPSEYQEAQKTEEQNIQVLMSSMDSTEDYEGRLTAGIVGNIVNLQAQEIVQAAEHYAELQAADDAGIEVGSTQAHAAVALKKQKTALEERKSKLESDKERLETSVKEIAEKLNTLRSEKQKLEKQINDKDKLITPENQSLLRKLQSLLALNENLKSQEQQFREQCKSELARWQQLIKDAEATTTPNEDSDQISKLLSEEQERVQKLRLQLAKRNRSIAALQRQLDELPERAELAQYQRRFLELYNQVAAKHKETKQFYTLYNTLDDAKLYASKEFSLLNSILENYTEAMSSANSKEQFMKQFDAIVEGVKLNKAKVERRRQEERQRRDKLSQQLINLVDQQRKYVAAVRQLTIECRRNESLLAQLRAQ